LWSDPDYAIWIIRGVEMRSGLVFLYEETAFLRSWESMMRHAKRIAVLIIGMTVLLVGVALIVLPGPAFVVIPIGLAILATEYAWARRALKHVTDSAEKAAGKLNFRHLFSRRREGAGVSDKE
jgi:uncharacterized protein (TIGR02611 family)